MKHYVTWQKAFGQVLVALNGDCDCDAVAQRPPRPLLEAAIGVKSCKSRVCSKMITHLAEVEALAAVVPLHACSTTTVLLITVYGRTAQLRFWGANCGPHGP
jgi:hypothetical protein